MSLRNELRAFALMLGVFLAFYFAPISSPRLSGAIVEAFSLVQWYARENMIYGLIPAFFIAGAIGAFAAKSAIMKYLGARAKRVVAYAVASISGCVLSVCSCTILPIFAGIYSRGAGLGPAITFLYAGPAINVLAIFLTARVLGAEIGLARALGAITFSIVIGLLMHVIFRKDEAVRADESLASEVNGDAGPSIRNALFFFIAMVAILVFANWADVESESPLWRWLFRWKWMLTAGAGLALGSTMVALFRVPAWKILSGAAAVAVLAIIFRGNPLPPFVAGVVLTSAIAFTEARSREWVTETWGFAKDMLPMFLVGIMMVGFALGRPGHEGLIPRSWVESLVGGNSVFANLVASVAGGLMYFCTMTEVPIVQGLLGAGMGKGPALAFLLAGPAVSLPNVLMLRRIIGTRKTAVYLLLVITMATITGAIFGVIKG